MRLYHLVTAKHGLDDLRNARLKVAEFADLNDPFELLAAELSDRAARRCFTAWRQETMARYGLLCFSRTWRNQVLWSHYAEKHRGICLRFDVPDGLVQPVAYLKKRPPVGRLLLRSDRSSDPGPLFHAKFEHWRYEDEVRRVIRLDTAVKHNGLSFWPFGPDLHLTEVIAGARGGVTKDELKDSLGDRGRGVTLTQARLAFKTFEVVTQKRGFPRSST